MAKLVLVLLLISTPVYAQENSDRDIANWASYATVIGNVTFDTIHSFRAPNKREALTKQGLRLGTTVLASEIIKKIVHKKRPNGKDDKSFWSEHTAIAAASQGWNFYVGGSLTFGTAAGRVTSKWHDAVDVSVGAGVGTLIERLIH